jgi:hypothetical protein
MSCTFSGSPRAPKNRFASSRGHDWPLVSEILLREIAHLLLDGLEVFGHERLRHDEVVEEAIVGGGTDAALHAGIQARHRLPPADAPCCDAAAAAPRDSQA